MSKIQYQVTGKRIARFVIINIALYITACFVLISWPIPAKKSTKNYDYSSIKKKDNDSVVVEERWIQLRDGTKLFNRIYPSDNKDIMILIHGSGSESRYLKRLARKVANSKMATVITPDLRGHGRNKGEKGDINYVGQLEDDLEDLIKYSKERLGARRIILAGHSSGGGLVLRFIGNRQTIKVDKAIMLSPYLGHDAPTTKPNSGNWVTVAIKRWVGLSMLNRIGISTLDELTVLFFNRPESYNDNLQAPSYSYRMAVNFGPKNYKEDIEKITVPCLVLVGGKDESFYPDEFKNVFKPVQAFVQTEILSDANHLDIVSRQESLEQIINWLKK